MKQLLFAGLLATMFSGSRVLAAESLTVDTLTAFAPGKVQFVELVGRVGNLASDSATVIFFMPEDISSIDPQRKTESKELGATYRRTFKRPVTLIMVAVAADKHNKSPLVIWRDYEFGVLRGGKEVKALATTKIIWAEPDSSDIGFVVFPANKFKGDEIFYIKFP